MHIEDSWLGGLIGKEDRHAGTALKPALEPYS